MEYVYVMELKFHDGNNFNRYYSSLSYLKMGYEYESKKSANAGAVIKAYKVMLDSNIIEEINL